MVLSLAIVVGSLFAVLIVIVWKGLPGLTLSMITQTPKGGFYLGGEGGILNAIVGSLCLGIASTAIATVISIPIALALQKEYLGKTRAAFTSDLRWMCFGEFHRSFTVHLGS